MTPRDIPIPARDREEAAAKNGTEVLADESLTLALLAVQSEAPKLQKNAINPHFKSKYVSLDTLMDAVMPVLTKHGLVWLTLPGWREHDGAPVLTYRLIHTPSGDELEGEMPLMLAKTDPQGQGSAITYARRYSLMAVLGLVADEDDDGNQASKPAAKPQAAKKTNGATPPKLVEALRAAYKASGLTEEELRMQLVAVGVENVEDLTRAVNHLTPEQADELGKRLTPKAPDA